MQKPATDPTQGVFSKHNKLITLASICLLYLMLAVTTSIMTPAWEANDEADHTLYAEYILRNHNLPRIDLENGHESHQPPLYYVILSQWQRALRITAFTPQLTPATDNPIVGPQSKPILELSHKYTNSQKQQAISLHKLRILSVIFGLATVVLTFLIGLSLTNNLGFSAAAALFITLLPKQLTLSSAVTNDSLVILLSTLLLYCVIKLCGLSEENSMNKYFLGSLTGLIGGAVILTKLNSLPIVAMFLFILLVRAQKKKNYLAPILYTLGLVVACGWWLLRNWHIYGEPLAQTTSNNYLKPGIPGLVKPVSWFNGERFLHFVPTQLKNTAWYDGGWNQLMIPDWMSIGLWLLVLITTLVLVWKVFTNLDVKKYIRSTHLQLIIAAIIGGLTAVVIISKTTLQAEGRVTYVGLSAFAIYCTYGMLVTVESLSPKYKRAGLFIWPLCLILVDVYIYTHILFPIRGL